MSPARGPMGGRACPNRRSAGIGTLVVPLHDRDGALQVKDISGMPIEEAMEHWANILFRHAPYWLFEAIMGDDTSDAELLREKMRAIADAPGDAEGFL